MIVNNRLILDDGDSVPTCIEAVQIGDFIRDKDISLIIGKVTGFSHIGPWPCFLIERANGAMDFVLKDQAQILGFANCVPQEEVSP